MSPEPSTPIDIQWENLSPKYNYLKQFPGVDKLVELVAIGNEFVPSPEFPIHFVTIKPVHNKLDPELAFSIQKGEEELPTAIIIMDHKHNLRSNLGVSGAAYYQGYIVTTSGETTKLFSKHKGANPRANNSINQEIDAYQLLTSSNEEDITYLPPYFIPETKDELIMVDLKEKGYKELGFGKDYYSRETISTLPIGSKRLLFLKVMRYASDLFYKLLKNKKVPADILLSGKGIFVKPTNYDDKPDFKIVLADLGNINDLSTTPDPAKELVRLITEGDTERLNLLSFFSFFSINQKDKVIEASDPIIGGITEVKFKTGVNISELLSKAYRGEEVNGTYNNTLLIFSMFVSALEDETLISSLSKEIPIKQFTPDLLIQLISENPVDALSQSFIMKLAAYTGQSYFETLNVLSSMQKSKD